MASITTNVRRFSRSFVPHHSDTERPLLSQAKGLIIPCFPANTRMEIYVLLPVSQLVGKENSDLGMMTGRTKKPKKFIFFRQKGRFFS